MPRRRTRKPSRGKLLRLVVLQLEKLYDCVHRFLAWITGRLGKPMTAEIYHVAPIAGGVHVHGRVLLSRKWREPDPEDHPVVNLLQMVKRWATPERPRSLVRVSLDGAPHEQRADEEGYFEILVPEEDCLSDRLLVELPESEVSEPATHEVLRVGEDSRVLVVSDIDDTVLITHAVRTLSMIATTLFGNAMTRQLFPGVSELYRSLRNGPGKNTSEDNPLVYVTSSPYNLHGLIHLIFELDGLPLGPFFMTDWGLDVDKWFKKSHREHKLDAIGEILEWYPGKPVVLIGDSGQHDTMIYVEIALAHPGRIDLILIRDVTGPEHIDSLREKVAQLRDSGTHFDFFTDSAEAAEILAEHGWISEDQRARVREAQSELEVSLFDRLTDPHRGESG